jgi:hypothetical protein
VTLIIPLTCPFSDYFVLRYEEIRIGFQCFNVGSQGTPCNRRMDSFSCCPFCTLWLFQFEQSLRNADDPENLHQQAIAQTTVVYYCSRMEAVSLMSRQTYRVQLCTGAESCAQAWKEGNDSVAQYMLRNITGKFLRSSAKAGLVPI